MTNTTKATQLLSPRELAGVLGLCPDTVRRAAKAQAIPSLKIGGAIRFNPEHVETITRDGFAWPRKTGDKRA
jgi:excisionase family DNA binding protein